MLKPSVSCLKSVSRALVPDCLVPSQALLNTMFNSSSASYDPHPVNTSRVVLGSELVNFVEKFATHLHDCWIYEKQLDGWGYGLEKGDLLDPNMKPFMFLSEQVSGLCVLTVQECEKKGSTTKYDLFSTWTSLVV